MGANAGKEFPYEVGDVVSTFQGRSAWTLHDGRCKKDNSQVSIFSFNLERQSPDRISCARNGMKRLKTLMHPAIIKYLGGVELKDRIYIVTEHVTPLCEELSESEVSTDALAWGIHQVVSVVSFLHEQDLIHGNVNPFSVFVSDSGEWKLGSLDTTSSDAEQVLYSIPSVVDRPYWPPEVQERSRRSSRVPLFAIDAHGVGVLIQEVFQQHGIPSGLRSMHRKLTASNPSRRLNPSHVVAADVFDSPFVRAMQFLDNAAAKEVPEMVAFVTDDLPQVIESMSQRTLLHKVLPKLFMIMRFGGEACAVFSSIMKIVSRLPEDAVGRHALPHILDLLAANDSMIRLTILSHMEPFARHLDPKTTNTAVFPVVSANLVHQLPQLREAALKAVVHAAPHLTPEHTNTMLKHLWKLQTDSEAGIRTNTVVAFGKVAVHLSETNRRRILIPAFTRALKDTFHHTRNASLIALSATVSYYELHALARHVLPAVTPCLADPVRSVRESAFSLVNDVVRRLQEASQTDPSPFDPSERSHPNTNTNTNTTKARTSSNTNHIPGTAAGSSGNTDGYLSWAMSSLNKISSQAAAGVRGSIGGDQTPSTFKGNNSTREHRGGVGGTALPSQSHGSALNSPRRIYDGSDILSSSTGSSPSHAQPSSPISSSSSSPSSTSRPRSQPTPKRKSKPTTLRKDQHNTHTERKPKGMKLKRNSVESEIKRRAATQGYSLGRVAKTIRRWKDEGRTLDADQILAELGSGDRSWKKDPSVDTVEKETPDVDMTESGWGDGWDELLEDSLQTGNKKEEQNQDSGDLIQLNENDLDAWLDE